ncbi:GGDEF domain-containing protein [Stenotrophobium rhamnosiphilum]|uniref:diguanylate cyclase n=1 Tax=Stenotrophobium rhamnosiphilum TaxID=2029166 RepID=A0A2T5MJ19_9GAMM|nr:GGDEF domain-containing protein [Stenotrophobium rhamnosiphilum]PTU32572.1 hypothetical protein CJD38_00115 [Stenotrophobium rhamnosiphilum]
MARVDQAAIPSVRPDIGLLGRLLTAQKYALSIVFFVSGVVLLAWLIPLIGELLPSIWLMMKANSALCMMLGAVALAVTQFRYNILWKRVKQACAALLIIIASSALWAYAGGQVTGIETLLAADAASPLPGRMSVQAAIYFVILGLSLCISRPRDKKFVHLVDVLSILLAAIALIVLAGYCFGAEQLFAESHFTRVAPATLLCMVLLAFVRVGHSAQHSFFSVLIGIGIGSRTARFFLPFALFMPFSLVLLRGYVTGSGLLTPPYAAAMTAVLTSILLFGVTLWTAWRINDLERDLRDMSLTDELTQIYNRRGFYLLGEQALREARRSKSSLTTLFFDLDGLKQVNDRYGHEAGSSFLQDFASVLRANFRDADIVGRVGGDEFAVAMRSSNPTASRTALQRLDEAVADINLRRDRSYVIRFSVGDSTSDPLGSESFTDLLRRADVVMYAAKSAKKAQVQAS